MAEDKIVTKKTAAKKAVFKKTVTKKAAAVESDATAPAKTTADPVIKKTSAKPNGKKASAAPHRLRPWLRLRLRRVRPRQPPARRRPRSRRATKRAGRLHKLANVSPEKRTKMIEEAAITAPRSATSPGARGRGLGGCRERDR